MKLLRRWLRLDTGSALVGGVVFSGILLLAGASLASLSSFGLKSEHGRTAWSQAYYHSENALSWAAQKIADSSTGGTNAPFRGNYSLADGTIPVPYMVSALSEGTVGNVWVQIANHPSGVANLYRVTTSSKVGDKVRTLQASIRKNPPSVVFDYEYFLNNWGWWWGSTITGDGDNRANWDFDFRFNPTVNGSVIANGRIESNLVPVDPFVGSPPFRGLAASDLFKYVHSGSPRVEMPNLKDFSYYQSKATAAGGKLWVGSDLVISAVHTNTSKPGIYLVGTAANPIKVDGPVVIPGDVVIKGVITGIGSLYVGGNLYISGNVTYANGPDFSTPPESMSAAGRDAWVTSALAAKKDLVAFAVREAVYGGAPNTSHWKYWEYDAGSWGLSGLGDEGSLGRDGIRFTPDDGVNYLDTNADGTPDSAWFDADGDGIQDGKYNYSNDIKMTTSRANAIDRYPTDSSSNPVDFDTISSNAINRLDGIFYCNHAVAVRMGASTSIWNGTVISQDEAIVFNDTLKINYDSRIHSRYSPDPNRYIDIGLPVANLAKIQRVDEIAPLAGYP